MNSLSMRRKISSLNPTRSILLITTAKLANSEQPGNDGVPMSLLQQTLVSIHEQYGQTGGRRAGGHVARILFVAGSVGDDELAPGGSKIAISDIDRNALLAFRPQAVGDQREVDAMGPVRG